MITYMYGTDLTYIHLCTMCGSVHFPKNLTCTSTYNTGTYSIRRTHKLVSVWTDTNCKVMYLPICCLELTCFFLN